MMNEMSEQDRLFYEQAMQWLTEKPRNNHEIAMKILECASVSIRMTRDHYVNDVMNKIFSYLRRAP